MHQQLFFAAKGVYASWDHLGDISATVDLLQSVHKQVGHALEIAYHGITHTMPDMSAAINKIAYKVGELELHVSNANRLGGNLIRACSRHATRVSSNCCRSAVAQSWARLHFIVSAAETSVVPVYTSP